MKRQLIKEVRQFQKIAGLLKESFDRDAPESNTYEDVRDWLDNLYPDASQYPDFLTDFKKELQSLTPEEKVEWIAKFKRDFGEDLNEWHPDKEWDEEGDQEDTGEDYPSDEELFGVSEEEINEAEGFKFKKGDVVKSRISKGNDFVVLIAYPNLEAAYKDRGKNEPNTWEDSIVNGEMGPVSDDVANKPWYLTWTREVQGEDLITCDPEEFLSK